MSQDFKTVEESLTVFDFELNLFIKLGLLLYDYEFSDWFKELNLGLFLSLSVELHFDIFLNRIISLGSLNSYCSPKLFFNKSEFWNNTTEFRLVSDKIVSNVTQTNQNNYCAARPACCFVPAQYLAGSKRVSAILNRSSP